MIVKLKAKLLKVVVLAMSLFLLNFYPKPCINISAETNTSAITYGDVNNDGLINNIDYILINRYLLGSTDALSNSNSLKAADVNGDGKINSIDSSLIKRYILGITNNFPVVPTTTPVLTPMPTPVPTTTPVPTPEPTLTPTSKTTGGYSTATGSSISAVTVKTLSQLESAFNAGNHHIIISGNIYGGSKPKTLTFASTSWNNITIEGESGGNAVLRNIQLKFDGELLPSGTNISNIVVKNITFYGEMSDLQALSGSDTQPGGIGTNYLGLSFRRCTNVWVDHCTIYNTSDDLMCITLGSDNVTVSYCHFYFTQSWINMNPNPIWNWVGANQDLASERLAMVIGANASDSYTYGGKLLHVTMHHNWFGPNMKGRPLMRGFVHLYNNYFDNGTAPSGKNSTGSSQQQYNANQIGSGSVIYSESNYFYKTNQSNQIGLDKSTDTYSFYEKNNYYNATTGISTKGVAYPSSLPFSYSYSPEPVDNVPNDVQTNAGPR